MKATNQNLIVENLILGWFPGSFDSLHMSKSDLSYLAKCNYGEKAIFIVPRLDCARTIRTK